MKYIATITLLLLFSFGAFAQILKPIELNIEKALANVSVEMVPYRIPVGNAKIPADAGHQQGVQYYYNGTNKYLVISGSSAETAYYYMVLLTDSGNSIVHYKAIAQAPFSHAGGIQVFQNYLFVGVEDDDGKMRSQVHIYDISNPGVSDLNPLYIIDREGFNKEKTAGAIGVTMDDGQLLLAVASWDSRTVDFYRSNMKQLTDKTFAMQLVSTWKNTTADKDGWISKWWYPYQNINLFVDDKGKVNLAGFTKHKDGNFMELFSVEFLETDVFFVKNYSKQFYCAKGANFRYGGGIHIIDAENIAVMAVSKLPKGKVMVNWFGPKK